MEKIKYEKGTIVEMKKGHPCGENKWEITRVGADIKVRCLGCSRLVMLKRHEFDKKVKRVL